MSATGTFVLESNDNYDAWLKAVGVPAETAAKVCAAKPVLEVSNCDGGLCVKTTVGDKVYSNCVTFGKDSPTDLAGLKYTLNTTKTDTGYGGKITLGSKSGTFTVEITDSGFTQTVTVDGVVGKRIFKKQ